MILHAAGKTERFRAGMADDVGQRFVAGEQGFPGFRRISRDPEHVLLDLVKGGQADRQGPAGRIRRSGASEQHQQSHVVKRLVSVTESAYRGDDPADDVIRSEPFPGKPAERFQQAACSEEFVLRVD